MAHNGYDDFKINQCNYVHLTTLHGFKNKNIKISTHAWFDKEKLSHHNRTLTSTNISIRVFTYCKAKTITTTPAAFDMFILCSVHVIKYSINDCMFDIFHMLQIGVYVLNRLILMMTQITLFNFPKRMVSSTLILLLLLLLFLLFKQKENFSLEQWRFRQRIRESFHVYTVCVVPRGMATQNLRANEKLDSGWSFWLIYHNPPAEVRLTRIVSETFSI